MAEKSIINAIDLPIIDYSKVVGTNNDDSRRQEASRLVDAFTNVGFAMVQNIEGYNEEELFQWIQWFYYDVSSQVFCAPKLKNFNLK